MNTPQKPLQMLDGPMKTPTGAESPTTARPFELDDDETFVPSPMEGESPAPSKHEPTEEPPAKPPRPLNPLQVAENTLKEAFPSIDASVVKAILRASGGQIEPAFNALLGMSDPEAAREPSPPPQLSRPTQIIGSTPQSQLESDERYARQLAEQYEGIARREFTDQAQENGQSDRTRGTNSLRNDTHEEWSFIEDDLPIIKDHLKKGFLETQSKVNSWITTLKKKIDGEDEEDNMPHDYGASYRPRRSNEDVRRSGDYNRYDADPQVLGDDFAGIQMNSDGTLARPITDRIADQMLFEPQPAIAKVSNNRAISDQGTISSEKDIYNASPKPTINSAPIKQSKWQPLSSAKSKVVGETDNDPFSLGDSEDEKEVKERIAVRGKVNNVENSEDLKLPCEATKKIMLSSPTKSEQPADAAS
ncbi:BgTH12-07877 [Blumeria graminis f. sp. triticale]|uniref:BgTH12-07877 n=1 Tax=Blumeria graminis f. sp. triticale TaxID=1689686 RepID=A0A9W4D015_BLUGR|nr:BgTH12-07877 [Blumeria graminis f. sp. triticale]